MWMNFTKDWIKMGYRECVGMTEDGCKWRSMTVNLLGVDETW